LVALLGAPLIFLAFVAIIGLLIIVFVS